MSPQSALPYARGVPWEVLYDALEERLLTTLVRAFSDTSTEVLIFKGAALARTDYPKSAARQRSDIDLLVRGESFTTADRLLKDTGCVRIQSVVDPRVMGQCQYRDGATDLLVDLHWRLFEPSALARLVSFDELLRGSQPLGGTGARAPGPAHAMWIALLHPVAHHGGAFDEVWQSDVRKLAERFTADDWRAFRAIALDTGTRAICHAGLSRLHAAGALPTLDARDVAWFDVHDEATRAFLSPSAATPWGRHLANVRATPSWRGRVAHVARAAFPPASYMLALAGRQSMMWLPWLYAARMVSGARDRWRRPAPDPRERFESDESGGSGGGIPSSSA